MLVWMEIILEGGGANGDGGRGSRFISCSPSPWCRRRPRFPARPSRSCPALGPGEQLWPAPVSSYNEKFRQCHQLLIANFFASIPLTYTSSPRLMAQLGIIFYLHGYASSCNLLCLDPFFLPPYTRWERRKTIWSELEWNPGPLALQATALHARPFFHAKVVDWRWWVGNSWICQRTLNWFKKFLLENN